MKLNLKINKQNLPSLIVSLPIIAVIITAIIISFLIVFNITKTIKNEQEKIKQEFFLDLEKKTKQRVEYVYNLIDSFYQTELASHKRNVKLSVDIAYEIIKQIYDQYKHMSKSYIIDKIKALLNKVRFYNDKSGYYFIYDMRGTVLMLPTHPSLEGKSLLNYKDPKGKYIVKNIINILKTKDSTFQTWYYYKPNSNKIEKKLGYIKVFRPLNIFIGSAEYFDNINNSVFENMRKILDKVLWKKDEYIFIFDYKGNVIYHLNKEFIGTNRWNSERGGVKNVQLIINSALENSEGTYVKYLGYHPNGKPMKKISFVKYYKPLRIVVGHGLYLDQLNKLLLEKQKKLEDLLHTLLNIIIITALVIGAIIVILMYVLSLYIKQQFKKYDIQIRKKQQKLLKKATYDTLTNLYNRDIVLDLFENAKKRADQLNTKIAILFIDLDHFKEINDSLGHKIGDEVLKIIAKRLKSVLKNKVIARFGGDEFVVMLEKVTDKKTVETIAKKILKEIKKEIFINNQKCYLSGSIGISFYPDDAKDFDTLLKYADTAMYKAKREGKDRYYFFNSTMSKEADLKIQIKSNLIKALKNNEFELYYQPQIDKNGKLIGMESLIRWNHPEKGVISPFYFIPVAIEMGIIDEIDSWSMKTALLQIKDWIDKGYNPPVVSCNLTTYHIEKGNLIKEIKKIFDEVKIDTKYLALELTEEGIMKNPEKSIQVLNELKQLGIGVYIDDFGMGQSSLSYLKKLPIDKLKIDRNFIKDIPDDKDDIVITKTIIALAKEMNLQTVAEGVETKIQRDFVFEIGCNAIQGYYYSKPIPAKDFEEKYLKG